MSLRPPSRRLLALGLSVAVILILMACTPSHNQSTFDPLGPVAEKQLTLFNIIFWAAMFVFIVVGGALIYTVIRFRRRAGQTEIPAQTHGNTPLEIGWTIAPAIVLLVVAVPTVIYIFDISGEPPPDALEVNVIGHQWWWEFEYPEQNVVTANELHIPVDVPIKLNLTSDDVIHSFWVPKLAGKQDVIPTNLNTMQFTASGSDIDTLPAILFGQCAEFCGVAHAHMRLRVVVKHKRISMDGWQTTTRLRLVPLQQAIRKRRRGSPPSRAVAASCATRPMARPRLKYASPSRTPSRGASCAFQPPTSPISGAAQPWPRG